MRSPNKVHYNSVTINANTAPSMTKNTDTLLLSDILKSSQQFSFFHELLNLKQIASSSRSESQYLLKYDLQKIEYTINDIAQYLSSLIQTFNEIEHADIVGKNSMTWIYEGKSEIVEVAHNLNNIDDIISQLLVLLETKLVEADDHEAKLFKVLESFDHISDLCLQTKKYSITYKKRLDICELYHELDKQIIGGIDSELNECLKQSCKIQEIRLTSPYKASGSALASWNILQLHHHLTVTRLRLPIFNDHDKLLYEQYTKLDERVKPLNMSLQFVPPTIENFKMTAADLYPDLIDSLKIKYDQLQDKISYLNKELAGLRKELFDLKWLEIFQKFLTEAALLLQDLQDENLAAPLGVSKLTRQVHYKINVMEKTIALMAKILKLHSLRLELSIVKEHERILKNWNDLNVVFSKMEKETINELNEDEKLQILSTVKRGYEVFEILPDFLRREQKLKDLEKLHAASPSKVNRRQAMGNSLSSSLSMELVYIDKTPNSSVSQFQGKKMIHEDELKDLKRNNDVTSRLMSEVDDLSSLTGKLSIHTSSPKDLSTIREDSPEEKDIKLQQLIQEKKKKQSRLSKIPVPTLRISSWQSFSSSRSSIVISRPPSSLSGTPSMIPRPVSVSSSRSSSRCSSRASSRASASSLNSDDNFSVPRSRPHARPLSSSSNGSGRLNLSNITNISNSSSIHSLQSKPRKSALPLLRTDARSIRRPQSSLSHVIPSRRSSLSSGSGCDDFF